MKNWLCVATAMIIGATCFPAEGHWQFTRWGMTQAQVTKASQGRAVRATPKEVEDNSTGAGTADLKMEYRSGRFLFDAFFQFGSGKLVQVVLMLKGDSTANQLERDLRSKYGMPLSVQNIPAGQYSSENWFSGEDEITMFKTSGTCSLVYSPRIDADNKGL